MDDRAPPYQPRSPIATPIAPTQTPRRFELIDRYWRAANYLSVGQIYLTENPLLREPLALAHVKPLVVGHWAPRPARASFTSTLIA